MILAAEASTWIDRICCPVHLVAGAADPVVDHAHLGHIAGAHTHVSYGQRPGRHDLPLTDAVHCAELIRRAAAERAPASL